MEYEGHADTSNTAQSSLGRTLQTLDTDDICKCGPVSGRHKLYSAHQPGPTRPGPGSRGENMGITDTLTTHLVIRIVSLVSHDKIPLLLFADVWPPSPLMYVTTGGDMARVAQAACPPLLGAGVCSGSVHTGEPS